MENCKSAAKAVADLFNKSGDEISKLGCKAASTVGGAVGAPIDHTACLQTAEKAEEYIREMIQFWNNNIAGNSSFKIGPRFLTVKGRITRATGNVISKSQRTFITQPLPHDEYSLDFNEIEGKADTDVYVCVYDSAGRHQNIASRHFNNNKARKNNSQEKRSVKLSDVKGKILVILIQGNSVGRNFGYEFFLKRG